MATQINNPAADKSILAEARQLVAEHPHFMGLTVGAVAAALSHFYYDNAMLTSVGMFIAGFATGEILSRIVASARELEETAAMGREAVKNLAAAGKRADEAAAKAADLEQALLDAGRILAANGEEIANLRKEVAEEAAKAEAFRAEVRGAKAAHEAEKAKAQTPVVETPAPVVEEGKKAPKTKAAA